MKHCQRTTLMAHFLPSSRFIEAIAATQGVYKRENTRSEAAEAVVINALTFCPYRISNVETTLYFAINPLISAVQILQSPKPMGAIIGANHPAIIAKILSC